MYFLTGHRTFCELQNPAYLSVYYTCTKSSTGVHIFVSILHIIPLGDPEGTRDSSLRSGSLKKNSLGRHENCSTKRS